MSIDTCPCLFAVAMIVPMGWRRAVQRKEEIHPSSAIPASEPSMETDARAASRALVRLFSFL